MKNIFITVMSWLISSNCMSGASQGRVVFKDDAQGKKVEVYIDNRFFTAYIYPDIMENQSLYPILSASGKTITRGYPLDPRPYERVDHPQHVGMWLNFGDVNGLDFWNNSFAVKPADKPKFGSTRFRKIISEKPKKGTLVTQSEWVDINDNVLISEESTYVFWGNKSLRSIEKTTKLTAVETVTFNEDKEGLFGIRVDRAFEEPSTIPELLLDSNGKEPAVLAVHNEGVNGVYRNAEGFKGSDVWSKRSPWVALRAEKEGEIITIVTFDHPDNINYPAWSHARGYGLFGTNNLGGRSFDKNTAGVKVVLSPGESITFKHKLVIGGDLTDAEINKMAKQFK